MTDFHHKSIKDHSLVYEGPPCIFCWKAVQFDDKMSLVAQLNHLVAQKNNQLLEPPNVWCEVCIQT